MASTSVQLDGEMSLRPEDLPAVHRAKPLKHKLQLPRVSREFVDSEFSTAKFDALDRFIWMAGRPYPPRPLNIQKVLRREIISMSDISLHLVWTTGKIYIKPVPRFLLDPGFYDAHLKGPVGGGTTREVHRSALGFLYTYFALIMTELDFEIAKKEHLLPSTCDWESWRELAARLLKDHSDKSIELIPVRYKYGELRLSRLNKICLLYRGRFNHGYSALTSNNRYGEFLAENLRPIAAAVAYLVVLLQALQVGLATGYLSEVSTFQQTAVGFAIFAILLPIVAIGLIMAYMSALFLFNLIRSIIINKQRDKEINIEVSSVPRELDGRGS